MMCPFTSYFKEYHSITIVNKQTALKKATTVHLKVHDSIFNNSIGIISTHQHYISTHPYSAKILHTMFARLISYHPFRKMGFWILFCQWHLWSLWLSLIVKFMWVLSKLIRSEGASLAPILLLINIFLIINRLGWKQFIHRILNRQKLIKNEGTEHVLV